MRISLANWVPQERLKLTARVVENIISLLHSNDSNADSEPPRKRKRRSKWGIKPEGGEGESESAPAVPSGPKGAEAAAAKINAMLASQGKLAKSDPPPYKPVLVILLKGV